MELCPCQACQSGDPTNCSRTLKALLHRISHWLGKRWQKTKPLLFLTIPLLSTNWSHAETLVQLRNRVDTWLTNNVPNLVAKQNTYAANHSGRFFQGLITHSSIPAHVTATAGDVVGDRLTFRPTDQAETWQDFLPEFNSEVFAAAAQVNVYNGPAGHGWTLTVYVRFNGVIYQRCKSFGPDVSFDFAWRIFDPDAP